MTLIAFTEEILSGKVQLLCSDGPFLNTSELLVVSPNFCSIFNFPKLTQERVMSSERSSLIMEDHLPLTLTL